jgi:hypothetical protein
MTCATVCIGETTGFCVKQNWLSVIGRSAASACCTGVLTVVVCCRWWHRTRRKLGRVRAAGREHQRGLAPGFLAVTAHVENRSPGQRHHSIAARAQPVPCCAVKPSHAVGALGAGCHCVDHPMRGGSVWSPDVKHGAFMKPPGSRAARAPRLPAGTDIAFSVSAVI